ncbi:MAG: repeat-containing protein [Chloroflexi bacterium]|nr:repeat-containing protein [Chloroflexota bacterium]
MRSLLAGMSRRHRLALMAVVLGAGLAVSLGVLDVAGVLPHKRTIATVITNPAFTSTNAPLAPNMYSPTPRSTASPVPTLSLPATASVASRPLLRTGPMVADLLPGGSDDPPASLAAAPTPNPVYVAEDTLTGTGPGPAGPLSGLPTRPELAKRRPVAVVLDNYSPDARPQAGLNRASVVFETVAEGGITRFMAVFLERDAPLVGPVRSARIYFDSWAAGLNAIYGHAGGNNDALAELPSLTTISNVDGLVSSAFWRSGDRAMPHNLYTSSTGVRAAADIRGNSVALTRLLHKQPAPPALRPAGGSITIDFSRMEYNVEYRYNPKCNCYPRSMSATPHMDAISLRQIAPSNVVVLYADVTPDHNSDTPGSVYVQTSGIGEALYFRDGTETRGYWQKGAASDQLQLLNLKHQPIALNPGQTWFEVVPTGNTVSWILR